MNEIEVSRPTVVTPPTVEPVTLSEAKKQCELSPTDTTHDSHLTLLIQAAREQWEHDTDSTMLTTTLSVTVEELCDDEIYLPSRPIQSVSSFQYYNTLNVQTTFASTEYQLDKPSRAIRLAYLKLWPTTIARWDAVTITYVAGYTSAALVPASAKQAMLLLIGKYFEARDLLVNDLIYTDATYKALVARFMRSTYP